MIACILTVLMLLLPACLAACGDENSAPKISMADIKAEIDAKSVDDFELADGCSEYVRITVTVNRISISSIKTFFSFVRESMLLYPHYS